MLNQGIWTQKVFFFHRVIPDISAVQKKTTLTISDCIETDSPFESKVVKLVSLSTVEITEITQCEKNVYIP